ncbi:MAG TPA: hypothetical protein VF092_04135 [Longimicrobium sp.]
MNGHRSETFDSRRVTYTIEVDGELVVIAHVSARVNVKTGERFFAPETLERLQEIVWERHAPSRTIEAPVFEFAA